MDPAGADLRTTARAGKEKLQNWLRQGLGRAVGNPPGHMAST
jgi:hypothetical protein